MKMTSFSCPNCGGNFCPNDFLCQGCGAPSDSFQFPATAPGSSFVKVKLATRSCPSMADIHTEIWYLYSAEQLPDTMLQNAATSQLSGMIIRVARIDGAPTRELNLSDVETALGAYRTRFAVCFVPRDTQVKSILAAHCQQIATAFTLTGDSHA